MITGITVKLKCQNRVY